MLSKETQIVLLAAGGSANDDAIRELWGDDIVAPKLQFIAQWERATLVLWRRLRGMNDLIAGYDGAEDLRNAAAVWEFKLLQLEARLMQLVDIFDNADIDMMPLKGSGLAYTVYDSFVDRPMNDLDLLVPPEQSMRAWELTQENGWLWEAEKFPLEKYKAHHHLPPLKDASGSGVSAEIHIDMCLPGSPINYYAADVWADARTVKVAGHDLTIPSTAHQMIYTCIHFAWMHAMEDKAWLSFLDIGAYVASPDTDWPAFVDLARTTRADTSAYWTLRLARSLAMIPVPDDVLEKLKPDLPEFMLLMLERQYTLNMFPTDLHCPSVWLKNKFFQLGIQRGKHVVEMHDFVDSNKGQDTENEPAGFWGLLGNHMRSWKSWGRYLRMTIFGTSN